MAVARRASNRLQPDPDQQRAIEHVSGPMMVVAGAGTGKTTVLIQRIARLIREGHARPDEILALTYTNNAANEMLERVRGELSGLAADGLKVCTFHAYCNELLMRAGKAFRVLDDPQLWIFLRRRIRELHLNYYIRAASVPEFLGNLLEFMRRCQDELVGPEQYRQFVDRVAQGELPPPRVKNSKEAKELTREETLGRCREIAFVFDAVERLLREQNFGTFGHMIVGAWQLLSSDMEILQRERTGAKFILVDEFQDANYAQIKVLAKLAGEKTGAARNIFAVGDPDQGIYRFRGASNAAFELFQQEFPETQLAVLSKNRRSTTPVLRCAYALVSENPEALFGNGHYRRRPLISARDEQEPAMVRQKVEAVVVRGKALEAADLASLLWERRRKFRCDWKDFAILYRSHSHREEVTAELARRGIPFSIEGLDVLDVSEIRDLLACVAAVVSPNDGAALFRVAALRQFSIDPCELRAAMKALGRDAKEGFSSALGAIQGGGEVLRAIEQARIESAGKKVLASLYGLSTAFGITRTAAVQALMQFASEWEQAPLTETGSPGEFLEYLELFREAGGMVALATTEFKNAVRLMTAHSAKGLEFDHVFILRATSGSFPSTYREPLIELPRELRNSRLTSIGDEREVHKQEERRLFYVAMTRARDTLTIYGQYGRGDKDKTPPGFLREMIKNRTLKDFLSYRDCRALQTEIFAEQERPASSRLTEWIDLEPSPDLAATLSASAIQRYEICPLQFKLEREWRIPAEVSAALQYGASMHRVLLSYYSSVRKNRPLDISTLIELFKADLAGAGLADPYQHELYEKKGSHELLQFLERATKTSAEVLHTEEQFTIKLGTTNLVGRIDRIDRGADGGVIIVDYKTGRPRSQDDADESLQLSIYALAAFEKWGYRVERLVFHNLEGDTAISTTRSSAQIDAARRRVEDIAAKIAAGQFEPRLGIHCAWCVYRNLCPRTEKQIPEMLNATAAERS